VLKPGDDLVRFVGPDGTEHPSAHLIFVSNDRYELRDREGFGVRSAEPVEIGIDGEALLQIAAGRLVAIDV
jgi:hypothetical protein